MGRYCKICGRTQSNESFSGKGHKNCICKRCQKLPKETLSLIQVEQELHGYWEQSNISKLNLKRLEKLKTFPSESIQKHAQLLYDIALVKSHKKRRLKWLKEHRLDLFHQVRSYFHGNPGEFDEEIHQEFIEEEELYDDSLSIF